MAINSGRAIKRYGGVVGATAVTLTSLGATAEEIKRTNRIWFTCSVAPINYAYDGVAVQTGGTGGHLLPVGGPSELSGDKCRNIQWIRAGTDDGAVVVTLEE